MRESAEAALSYLRSNASEFGIDSEVFENHEIHIHVPSGAMRKDGPSAGVTMLVALASLLTGSPVRGDLSMTGEISLRGRVLPVGGIKAKVLGAARAGIDTVVLPRRNEKDMVDVPPEILEKLRIVFIDTIDEALKISLEPLASG